MIKILMLMKQDDDVPLAAFRDFRKIGLPNAFISWDACRRYVQYDIHPDSPQLAFPLPLELTVDAIDEIWLDETLDDQDTSIVTQFEEKLAASLFNHFVGAAKLYAIEKREVKPIGSGEISETYLKRLVLLARKQGSTHEQFLSHWNNIHANLLIAVKPGPLRYCQLCVLSELRAPTQVKEMNVDIDGLSESWFTDERAMNAGRETAEGIALAADNAKYVGCSKRIFFDEREILNRVPN